jgi:hypothetical protein
MSSVIRLKNYVILGRSETAALKIMVLSFTWSNRELERWSIERTSN